MINKDEFSWQFYVCQSKWKPIAEPLRAKDKSSGWGRTAVVQVKSEAINNDWDYN